MPTGIEHTSVIDVIAHDATTDEVALIMIEHRSWEPTEERLFQLQEKINAYLSFALDGEMSEEYPDFAGKALRLQLDCAALPDPATSAFLHVVQEQIAFQNIRFIVKVKSPAEGGGGCDQIG